METPALAVTRGRWLVDRPHPRRVALW